MARPPSFDKQTVLHAAELQFRKTGYAGTSLDDIAAVTGLGRGSLYAAFGDKHSLFLQALAGYCERSEAATIAALAGPDAGALERLREYLAQSVRFLFEDEDRLGCMAGRFAVELGGSDNKAATLIRRKFTLLKGALSECVQAAQRHGDMDPLADPEAIAALLLTVTWGMDVVATSGSGLAELTAIADRAFAGLPLSPAGRDALTAV